MRPTDVVGGPLDERVLGDRAVGWVGGQGRAVGGRVVAETRRPRDLPPLGLDAVELVEPDLVDLCRIEVERRPAPDRGPVELVAIGRRPEPGVLARRGQVVALEGLEERRIRRVDARRGRCRGCARGPPRWRPWTIDGHDRRLDRDLQHALDLGDRPLGHDPRRRQPRAIPSRRIWVFAAMNAGIRVEPGDECLEAAGVSTAWNWVSCGRSCCGPLIWSTTRSSCRAWSSSSICELRDDLEHVAGDPVLGREPVGRRSRRPRRRSAPSARGRGPDPRGPDPRAGRHTARRRRTSRSSG